MHRRAHLRVAVLIGVAALAGEARASFTADNYQPLAAGAEWVYLENGTLVTEMVQAAAAPADWVVETSGGPNSGAQSEILVNAAGIFETRRWHPSLVSLEFTDPLLLLPAVFEIGTSVSGNGSVLWLLPGATVPLPLNYFFTLDVVAEEQVIVPAGTFNAVRVDMTFDIPGFGGGIYAAPPAPELQAGIGGTVFEGDGSDWYAPGVGLVQSLRNDGESFSSQLVSSNLFEPENEPPDCSGAAAALRELWPPNHDFRQVSIGGVTDPDGDPVAIAITGIFQDEQVDGPGSGHTCPDAAGTGTDTALLRSERNGGSDGRAYHVSFRAEDGQGGECTGTVSVCHAHDQGQGEECIDQGPLFDSTGPCEAGNDADGDGLLDSEEAAVGTHLLNPDSDGDGFSDAEELTAGSNPISQASTPGGSAQPTAVPALSTWGLALLVGLLAGATLWLSRRWLVRSA